MLQFTQPLLYVVVPDHSGKGVLVLTEQDCYAILQVTVMWSVLFLQAYYTLPNEVVGYDVACQVGKAYIIFPPASLSFLKGVEAIMRSRPFEFELIFLGNRDAINATGVIWGSQRLYHYVAYASGLVFSVSNVTITSVYELHISRASASTFEGLGYYYDCL